MKSVQQNENFSIVPLIRNNNTLFIKLTIYTFTYYTYMYVNLCVCRFERFANVYVQINPNTGTRTQHPVVIKIKSLDAFVE